MTSNSTTASYRSINCLLRLHGSIAGHQAGSAREAAAVSRRGRALIAADWADHLPEVSARRSRTASARAVSVNRRMIVEVSSGCRRNIGLGVKLLRIEVSDLGFT
jgi:hypothetical protein